MSPAAPGRSRVVRRVLLGLAAALLAAILAVVLLVVGFQAGLFHDTLITLVATRVGRPIEVRGSLEVRPFSSNPRVIAHDVVIGNPPWMPKGTTAQIGELALVLQMPGLHHRFGVESLTMLAATLHLARDADGRANWQWSERAQGSSKMAIVRNLSVPSARVELDDQRRHLKFEGTVSTQSSAAALKLEGSGQLNGRPADFEITGDTLAAASHREPYHFSYTEHSSGSTLRGTGVLPRPFDFNAVDATFEADGADLKDLFYLTGVGLINTGRYRLTGKFAREGSHFTISDIVASSGESDARGKVIIDATRQRSQLEIDLESRLLRMKDLGERAAGRAPPETQPPLLLSRATLKPETLRRADAKISFHATRIDVGRISLTDVSARAALDRALLDVTSIEGKVLGGTLHGRARLDANHDPPQVEVDLRVAKLALDQIHRKEGAPPAIEGPLNLHVAVHGRGTSAHEVAATSDGIVTAVVPRGTMRDSLAELTGLDLRGLGLLLAKDKHETELRCAAAVFQDHEGTLSAQTFVADTEPVLIKAEGAIRLDSETLDLQIHGEPKSLRLFRWRSPLELSGTLSHPAVRLAAHQLKIIDPGNAKDADCAALIAGAEQAEPR